MFSNLQEFSSRSLLPCLGGLLSSRVGQPISPQREVLVCHASEVVPSSGLILIRQDTTAQELARRLRCQLVTFQTWHASSLRIRQPPSHSSDGKFYERAHRCPEWSCLL